MEENEISLEIGDVINKIEVSPHIDYPFGAIITECHVLGLDTRENVWLEYLDEEKIKRSKLFSLKTLVVLIKKPTEPTAGVFHVKKSEGEDFYTTLGDMLKNAKCGPTVLELSNKQEDQKRNEQSESVFSELYGKGKYKDLTDVEKEEVKHVQFTNMMKRLSSNTSSESKQLNLYKLLYSVLETPDKSFVAKKGDFVWRGDTYHGTIHSVLEDKYSVDGPTVVIDHGYTENYHIGFSTVYLSDIDKQKLTKPQVE
jgi:hypothetical protein